MIISQKYQRSGFSYRWTPEFHAFIFKAVRELESTVMYKYGTICIILVAKNGIVRVTYIVGNELRLYISSHFFSFSHQVLK